jgi:uncharacterized membrane protein YczE
VRRSRSKVIIELTIANTVDFHVGEDTSFMIVGPVTCLLNESRRKTMGVGFVVSKFRVHIVIDLKFRLAMRSRHQYINKTLTFH